ncbi:putative Lipoprotein [Pseudomonas syringae pv. actinidiae]|uniref:Putative Lipoprotein n=1 Tax=Pseudomonas syringae pv. actinidiae TaxID=103796 RepID=A0A7Z6U3M4_PSESF|nr:putative Lipoprotein [Pseudomonas syringae pv. actinidiae]
MLGRERAVRQFQKITSSMNSASKVPPPETWIRVFPWSFILKSFSKVVAAAVCGLVLAGCTGTPMKTQQYDSNQYTVVGHSEASATGLMLFGLIPIRQNDRFVRAQNSAIQAKGGDALINTQVQEKWFWAWVLNGYTTTVSGDVIKLKTAK